MDENSTVPRGGAEGNPLDDSSSMAKPNTFDFASLKLPQNFSEQIGVKKLLTTVNVKKPNKQEFIRVRGGDEFQRHLALIDYEEDDCFYAVAPNLVDDLADLLVPATLYTAVTRQGTVFLWPVRLPGPDGKSHGSWDSQRVAAEQATKQWLRIQWNKEAGAYDMFVAPGITDAPAWPDTPFNDLLKLAFKGRLIDSADHLVVKKLRGLA